MVRFALAATAAALALALAQAQLVYIDPATQQSSTTAPRVVVLPSFGETTATVSFFYKGDSSAPKASSGSYHTAGRVVKSTFKGYTNYTVPFTFNKDVGVEDYTFSVTGASGREETITGSFVVAGVTIKDGATVVSGDDGVGVSVKQTGTYRYAVKAVGTNGRTADVSNARITYKEMTGPYMKEVDTSSISSSAFSMTLADYRVGTGNFMVNMEFPSITKDGEVFETVLNVKQETSPAPPCVVEGGDIKITANGLVSVPMYNLRRPPQSANVERVVLTVGGKDYPYLESPSTLSVPDQTVVFKPTSIGAAKITCDGKAAKVVGGGGRLSISGEVPRGKTAALAVDNVRGLESSRTKDTFSVIITVVNSDPTLLSKSLADDITSQLCTVIGGTDCVYEKVTKGSAVMACAGHITKGDRTGEAKLRAAVDSCEFQKAVGEECPNIVVGKVETINARALSAPLSAVSTAGLATWTIVLIAVVGAFAIILLVMLALWAVYRRNAEQSESDYSSSGPMGVPDPSDLLYEQSIVRDIYGRGDFPEGGPSAAAAAERAREADLREEFPRPPSSSNASRAAATDDASSTYSV